MELVAEKLCDPFGCGFVYFFVPARPDSENVHDDFFFNSLVNYAAPNCNGSVVNFVSIVRIIRRAADGPTLSRSFSTS